MQENKVVLLYGPRRVGKTTVLKEFEKNLKNTEKIKFVNGETLIIQNELSSQSIEKLKNFVGKNSLLIPLILETTQGNYGKIMLLWKE